jgi:hypothetical protein
MNTKNKQDQKNRRQKTPPKQVAKRQGGDPNPHGNRQYHEHERIETRMFR